MSKRLYISLIFSNLVVLKTLSSNPRMYNLYTKFVKILEICKQFSENLVNESGNVPRRGPVPKFSDLEVVALSLTAETESIDSEKWLFDYKLQEYKDCIPNLISRRQFNDRRKKTAGLCEELRKRLEHYVPSIKACSPHTKRNYKISVKLYVEFLRVIKGTTPETLSAECFCMEYIMEWIIWLKENRGCSPATCNVRLSALRVFLKYLSFRDISYMSVFLQAENVPNEKNSKRKVIGLSKQAVDVLLSMPNQGSTIGFRDYTLMLLLYSTAVRINELLTLKISNIVIDCVKPHIIVIGKGRKKRPIPLLAKPAQCLKRYLIKYHPKQNDANALLFCSKSKGIYVPMSAENVNKMLKKYATMAHERCQDVPMDLHAHQFRHAKASHWLENGMNIAQISYLLGHESIQTTMVYLDITTKQEEKALETLEGENQKKMRKKWKTEEGKANLEILLGLTKTN